jgi:hypothetical protein
MNDFVECMVAAGWIDAGDVDDQYQGYLTRYKRHNLAANDIEQMTYEEWKRAVIDHIRLGEEFDRRFHISPR